MSKSQRKWYCGFVFTRLGVLDVQHGVSSLNFRMSRSFKYARSGRTSTSESSTVMFFKG